VTAAILEAKLESGSFDGRRSTVRAANISFPI
jgi:hypothetical protein